jgi:integrase
MTARRTKVKGKPSIYYHERGGRRRYEVTFLDETGRRRWQTVPGFDNLDEAEATLEEIKGKKRRGERVAPSKLSFDELADRWSAQLTVGERTREQYDANLRLYLRPRFGRRPAHSISADDVVALIAEMQRKGKAAWTIRNVLTTFSSLYTWASGRRKLVTRNPVGELERGERPRVRKRRGRTLQPDEIRALLDSATRDRYRVLLAFAIFTGCRLMETLGCRWADVDFEAGVIRVRRQLSRKGELVALKSEAAEREITLMPELAALLRRHLLASRYKQPHDFVFASETGGPLGWRIAERRGMDAAFEAAVKAKRIPAGRTKPVLHDCRHTFGSLLIAAGEDVYSVSRQMGHQNVSTTLDVYAGEIDRARNEAAQRAAMSARYGSLFGNADETTTGNQAQDPASETAVVASIRN